MTRETIESIILFNAISDQEIAVMVSEMDEDDFSKSHTRTLYAVIVSLVVNGGQVSLPTIKAEMMRLNMNTELLYKVTSVAQGEPVLGEQCRTLIYQLKEIAYRTRMMEMADTVKTMIESGESVDSVDKIVENVLNERTHVISYDEIKDGETLEELHRGSASYKTGLHDLDMIIGGIERSILTTIAARPGMGKTTFMSHLIDQFIMNYGLEVYVVSLEINKAQLATRILSARIEQKYSDIRYNPKRYAAEFEKMGQSYRGKFKFSTENNFDRVMETARYLARHRHIDVLFLDHIGLTKVPGTKTAIERLSRITGDLKQFALRYNIPVIECSQLNREVEKRTGPPVLADLRDCGSIEQDSNLILFIHYDPEDRCRKIIVSKNNFGPVGEAKVDMDMQYFKMRDVPAYAPKRFEDEREV